MKVEIDSISAYGNFTVGEILEAAFNVSVAFGYSEESYNLLVETCITETLLGTYEDKTPECLGVGVCQSDQIGLDDVQKHLRPKHRSLVKRIFHFDVAELKLADLYDDPIKAFVVCRLHYLRVPEPIPETIEGRAKYWKEHYNTYHPNAKGTVEGYIQKVERFGWV